ncbi:MAG: hypothetical protein ACI4SM_00170 [Candidatus Gastranaerophilaceae bacterium]
MKTQDRAIQIMSSKINDAIEKSIASSSFDRSVQGIVKTNLGGGCFEIDVKNKTYRIKTDFGLLINQVVTIIIPQNNPSNMYVLPPNPVNKIVLTNPELIPTDNKCVWECVHNKNTTDILSLLINTITGEYVVDPDIVIANTNSVYVRLNSADNIPAGKYKIIII